MCPTLPGPLAQAIRRGSVVRSGAVATGRSRSFAAVGISALQDLLAPWQAHRVKSGYQGAAAVVETRTAPKEHRRKSAQVWQGKSERASQKRQSLNRFFTKQQKVASGGGRKKY